MPSERLELSGHIIDSWTLPRSWDIIMDRGGNFVVEEMRVGKKKTEQSYVRLKVIAPDDETLELILSELQQFGAGLLHGNDVQTARVEQNGVLPDKFYSTTNLPTQVRLNGQWVEVEHIEMDVAIVIELAANRAYCKPMHEVLVGEEVVIGHDGLRVTPFERAREREVFAFMQSDISSEKAKVKMIQEIARHMQETRARGGKILFLAFYTQHVTFDLSTAIREDVTLYTTRGEGAGSVKRALSLARQGKIRGRDLVTHRFPLEQIQEGFRILREREGDPIKVVFIP